MSIAIITGASSGLGKEYVLAAARKYTGIKEFWLIARRADLLEELKEKLPADLCVKILPMDLNDRASLTQLSALLEEEKPQVSLLINNAGFGKLGYVWEIDPNVQRDMIDLNCGALTALTSLVIPYMPAGGGILNVCSIASFVPNSRMTVYSSTKAYVMSFSRALREELKQKRINVLAVCPGPMSTEFLSRAHISKGASKTFDTLPYCDPKEIAVKSLKALEKGKAVYTNRFLYKLYRVLGKLMPKALMMKFAKC